MFKTPLRRLGAERSLRYELAIATTERPIVCGIGFDTGKNLLYSFHGYPNLPRIPSKEQMDKQIKRLEGEMELIRGSQSYVAEASRYLNLVLTCLYFITIRRCFDFDLYPDLISAEEPMVERNLNLWEFLTVVISKVWFFHLLVELRDKAEKYFENAEIPGESMDRFRDEDMDRLLTALDGDPAFGIPAYASEGEVVILRTIDKDEMIRGFVATDKEWIEKLHTKLSYGKYWLRYQCPYGSKISSYPAEVVLSFRSPSFLDDRLGDWFGKTGLEHPLSKLQKTPASSHHLSQ